MIRPSWSSRHYQSLSRKWGEANDAGDRVLARQTLRAINYLLKRMDSPGTASKRIRGQSAATNPV